MTVPSHTRCPPPKRLKVQRVDEEGRNVGPARDYHAPEGRERAAVPPSPRSEPPTTPRHLQPRRAREQKRARRVVALPAPTAPRAAYDPSRVLDDDESGRLFDAIYERHLRARVAEASGENRAAAAEAVRVLTPAEKKKAQVDVLLRADPSLAEKYASQYARLLREIEDEKAAAEGVRGLDGSPIDVHGKRKATKANRRRIARLVIKRLVDVKGPAPRYEDIDPWAVDFLPCTGQTYKQFRSGFTRSEAYWHRAAGKEHGPSKRKVNTEHAQTKRAVWHKALYDCALAFWKYKNGIPLDAGEVDPTEFLDGLSGVSRKGKSMKKSTKKTRCKDVPKKVSRGCSEAAFKKNMRHLVCQGKRPQQAAAIAYALVYKGCGVKQTKRRRKVASIVASGKRKRARR